MFGFNGWSHSVTHQNIGKAVATLLRPGIVLQHYKIWTANGQTRDHFHASSCLRSVLTSPVFKQENITRLVDHLSSFSGIIGPTTHLTHFCPKSEHLFFLFQQTDFVDQASSKYFVGVSAFVKVQLKVR